MSPGHLVGTLAFLGFGAAAWFMYFRARDAKAREAVWLRVTAVGGGLLAACGALSWFTGIEWLGFDVDWARLGGPDVSTALGTSLVIGVVEESSKALPVLVLALWSGSLRSSRDGLLLAACSGLGFATAESAFLLAQGELSFIEGVARGAASPLTHALFAAPWGLGVGALVVRRRALPLLRGLVVSIGGHALYNLMLANPSTSRLAGCAVILLLWLWLMRVLPVLPARLFQHARSR